MNRLLVITILLLACFSVKGQNDSIVQLDPNCGHGHVCYAVGCISCPNFEYPTSLKDTIFSIEIRSYGGNKTYQKWTLNQDSSFFYEWNGSIYTSPLQSQIAYSLSSSEKSMLYKMIQYLVEKADGRRRIETNRSKGVNIRNHLTINHPISRSSIEIAINGHFTPFSLIADCINSMAEKRGGYLRGRMVRFQMK